MCGTFGGDFNFVILTLITPTLLIITCIMIISQRTYIQSHSFCQTKCPPIYITFQVAKLNVHAYVKKLIKSN